MLKNENLTFNSHFFKIRNIQQSSDGLHRFRCKKLIFFGFLKFNTSGKYLYLFHFQKNNLKLN